MDLGRLEEVSSLSRQIARRFVKEGAAAYDLLRPPPSGVTVLAYHRVGGGTELELDVGSRVFADQMALLGAARRVLAIDDALERLGAGPPAPKADRPPPVVVTFDDGTADFMDNALPALAANDVPATYYIATDFIESQRPFPDNGRPLSWAALRDAVSTGLITVGSHTHSHAVMDKLSAGGARRELQQAARLIEDNIGVSPAHFAYPKGVFGGNTNEREVAAIHRSAALADCRVNRYGTTDPLRLDRTPIQRSDSLPFFRRKVDGGMQLEGALRARLNRRRYVAAAN